MSLEKKHRPIVLTFAAAGALVLAIGIVATAVSIASMSGIVPASAMAAYKTKAWTLAAVAIAQVEAMLGVFYVLFRKVQSGHEKHIHEYEDRLEKMVVGRTLQLQRGEEHYRKLVESLPDGVLIHVEGRIMYANPAALRMFRAERPEQLVGKRLIDRVHPDYHEIVAERVAAILRRGDAVPLIEEKLVRLDGSFFAAEVSGSPIDHEGEPGVLVVFRDIEHRKSTETELRKASAIVASVVRESPLGIIALDLDGNVTMWNPAATRILGWTEAEVMGKPFPSIPRDGEGEFDRMRDHIHLGQEVNHAMAMRVTKDGRTIETHFWASPLRDASGKVIGSITMFRESDRA